MTVPFFLNLDLRLNLNLASLSPKIQGKSMIKITISKNKNPTAIWQWGFKSLKTESEPDCRAGKQRVG
jgi:hypothetical protein